MFQGSARGTDSFEGLFLGRSSCGFFLWGQSLLILCHFGGEGEPEGSDPLTRLSLQSDSAHEAGEAARVLGERVSSKRRNRQPMHDG